MKILAQFLFVLTIAYCASKAQAGDWEVRGRVVDESGQPVVGAVVDHFWSANGTGQASDGSPLDLTKPDQVQLFWGRVGQMEPRHPQSTGAKSGPDGSFSVKIPDACHAIMAMDQARERGGLAVIPKGREDQPVEIRLRPLVRVRGKFEGPDSGKPLTWTHVYLLVPDDSTRPLDSWRIAHCGSFESRFEFLLPPGEYAFDAYGQSTENDDIDVAVTPDVAFTVDGKTDVLDLGVLRQTTSPPSLQKRIEQSRAKGSWGDYTKHYGEAPPQWRIDDARGVAKDIQISDYRGKWVLIEFWGLGCRPCLSTTLPRLMKFYEEHAAQRDQFEILAVCIDFEGKLKSIRDVDRALAPIVKHVWGGKSLPFPILLDSSFETWERFGLQGVGTILLIDPDGKMTEGDEATLAERLKLR